MKIGIFTETYQPTVNGVVVSVDTFKKYLEARGHQCYIFAPFNRHAKHDPETVFRFPAIHFRHDPIYPLAIPMPFSWAKQQLPLDLIRDLDIIHIQHFAYMGQYGLKLAKEFNIPSVYTYHTMAELYTVNVPVLGSTFHPAIRWLTRYTARQADQVITPTNSVKRYLHSIGVTRPIEVIPTGINTKLYHRTNQEYARLKFNIPKDREILLFVGRLAKEKNVDFLLRAFQQVLLDNPHTHLLMIGSGPDRERYMRWIKQNGLAGHVTITGFLPREETIKLFGVGDLFTFPSTTDTQGIVILEAMAAGTPPVAIDILGPHDLVADGKTGALTQLNLKDFSDTISYLLQHKTEREKLARHAQETVKDFDAAVTAQKMEALYLKLIKKRNTKKHHG